MKFSVVVISVAIAATSTSAFTAPSRVNRGSSMLFSSEMKETAPTTTTTTTTEEDVPEKDMKKFEEKVAKRLKLNLKLPLQHQPNQ